MALHDMDLLRKLLDRHEEIRRIMPSESQLRLIRITQEMLATDSTQIAKRLGISVQCASGRLKELWRKGWLTRHEEPAPTGGAVFVYCPTVT